MFFIGGMSSKQDKLDLSQNIICSHCGKFGRYEVIMEYMYLSLFFIPILKWNIRYYVESSCCCNFYSISNEFGDRIARGEKINLTEQDLQLIQSRVLNFTRRCPNCGFETQEDFEYCPRCASPLIK